ncbi:hypothetical protein N8468_04730 [Planktomarina temperata]|nr:hypothetical protein [Planktomarina temperata]
MAAPVFTPLPTTPNRESSPETFSTDADAFLGALPTFQTEGNTLGDYCETQASAALTSANNAAASAALAQSSVTTYTNQATFDAVTPAANTLHILILQ